MSYIPKELIEKLPTWLLSAVLLTVTLILIGIAIVFFRGYTLEIKPDINISLKPPKARVSLRVESSQPLRVESGYVLDGHKTNSTFKESSDCKRLRGELDGKIKFDPPFASPPAVMLALTHLNTSRHVIKNQVRESVTVELTDTYPGEFNYRFIVRCQVQMWSGAFMWIAIGKAVPESKADQ